VFTEHLLINGLHNPNVPQLFGADDIENSLIYCCVLDSEKFYGHSSIVAGTCLPNRCLAMSWHVTIYNEVDKQTNG
jgi:hypothetical protein